MSSLLLSLRIAPMFAFAPPFSLVRAPALVRLLLGIGLAIAVVSGNPSLTSLADLSIGTLLVAAIRELMLGTIFVLAFQLTFGALYMAGRTIDIQAGFGLALVIDPTTRAQMPLAGTLFAYAAGAIFFALGGDRDLLRLIAASLEAIPLGATHAPLSIGPLAGFMSMVFITAFGVAGGTILVLFLADVAIAFLSRTVPQMNVLILGFQVKTLILLMVLPTSFGLAGALLARMTTMTLTAIPRLL